MPTSEEPISLPSGGALYIEGASSGDPVLFLHGVGGGAWSWRPQRAALAPSRPIFTWEARGRGSALPLGEFGFADFYADAREALAAVIESARRPAFLVGHSLGAFLALALACDSAAAVRGLCLIDPFYASGDGRAIVPIPLALAARFFLVPFLRSSSAENAIIRRLSRWFFQRTFENRERMEAAWQDQRQHGPLIFPRLLREALGAPTGVALRPFAAEIAAPTMVLQATGRGRLRAPELVSVLRERLGPHFHHEVVSGGHYLQLDQPDVVNRHLERFLASYATISPSASSSG